MSIFILLLFLWMTISLIIWSIHNGIVPMPTSYKVKKALFDHLPTSIPQSILELGSGWGTLVFPLAKYYSSTQVIGYETSPIPYLSSQVFQLVLRYPNLIFIRKDFFSVNFSDASLIICYLYPAAMQKLKEKFEKELALDTIVITHTFAIPGWKPYQVIEVDDLYHTKIYFYKRLLA